MSNPVSVHLRNIRFTFNDTALFDGFSLTLEGGKCTCLLGQSGCGKSTLLGLISGNVNLRYTGQIDFSPPGQANHIGWMAQDDLLLPWLSVRDNVLLGAKLRFEITPGLVEQADQFIQAAGLEGYGDAFPAELSGGMRQRVALLRTLIEDRPVVLMDEPFSALDALTRMKLQNLAARLLKNKTMVMVTHDPLEALRLADRIVVIGGKPVQIISQFDLVGNVPRDTQDKGVLEKYSVLLKQLLEDDSL